MTPAQKRALHWLSPGAAPVRASRDHATALAKLWRNRPDLVLCEALRDPQGRGYRGYRLTEAGAEWRHADASGTSMELNKALKILLGRS